MIKNTENNNGSEMTKTENSNTEITAQDLGITQRSFDLFIQVAEDAGNVLRHLDHRCQDLLVMVKVAQNKFTHADRDNLTQLKKAGLVMGGKYRDSVNYILFFTEAGKSAAAKLGIDLGI